MSGPGAQVDTSREATAAPADPVFSAREFSTRREAAKAVLAARGWRALIVADPANIYYLTGLNYYGYFAATLLVVTAEGDAVLFARRFEGATAARQCWGTRFCGLEEDDDAANVVIRELASLGVLDGKLAIELGGMFLPPAIVMALRDRVLTGLDDGSGTVEELRAVKSPAELELTRRAGVISEAIAEAAFAAAREGVNEQEVAAEAYRAMIAAGSEPSAFPPLIRSTETLRLSHTSWRDRVLRNGDALLVEVSGSADRYHAPHTRLGFIGDAPPEAIHATGAAIHGIEAIARAIGPGAPARDVYSAWHEALDAAGMPQPPRAHVGYATGIGFPPSWMVLIGGNKPVSLRPTSSMILKEGMVLHIFSWALHDPPHIAAISDTVIVTTDGCEVVTKTDREARALR